jgi:alpha-tubulin suppressor-like RCC1 family protein
MKRRQFLNFAGALSGVTAAGALLKPQSAEAQTWRRLTGTSTAGMGVKLPNRLGGPRAANKVIDGGYRSSMAIRGDGSVFSTGENNAGNLGFGNTTSRSVFAQATGISNAVALAVASTGNAYVVRSDGLVFACGSNLYTECGDDAHYTDRSTFVQATGVSRAIAVAGGNSCAFALRSDGLVFAVGDGAAGKLGQNNLSRLSVFVQATGISQAVAISAYGDHALALRSDGLVYACGDNGTGRLGDGSTTSRRTFVQCLGISSAIAIANGNSHSVALRADGLVFSCGAGTHGKLGRHNTSNFSSFVQATGISNAIAIAAGQDFTLALRSDGQVFACGYFAWGALGDGAGADNRSTFVQAVGLSHIVQIAAGQHHSLALRSDGTLWACGYGSGGQGGNGTTSNYASFVQASGI